MLKNLIFFLITFNTSIFCQENRSDSLVVEKYLQEGNRLSKKQEYEKAIVSYLNAIEVLEKSIDSSKIASIYTNIGVVNARLKNFDQAILYLEKANKLTTKNDNTKLKIIYNLSGFYYDNNNFTSFLSSIQKAENLALNLRNSRILSAIYNAYCNYYRDIKNYKTSIKYGLKSYALKKKLGLNPDITINNIGYSYFLGGNYKQAIEYLSKITKTPNKQLRAYVFKNLKKSYEQLGKKDKALLYANKYIVLNDSLAKAQEKIKVASVIEKYEASKKQDQIAALKTENKLKAIELKNQQNWFLGFVFFTMLSAFLMFLWFKNKKVKQELEKASIQHKLLRSQLNPHFLFHSLNSIQSYIYQNKKEASANYLANYSKLIRAIFDSSDKDFITVKEDKIAIENYLALQKLNFNEKVSLSLSLDNAILHYKIPPMFIQPFVENAFLHGISAVENGKISVTYQEENDNIKVCVTDNGKGFERLKNNNTLSKVSSSDVIKKRIENLKKTYNYTIDISTKSNKNGTSIILLFPKKIA